MKNVHHSQNALNPSLSHRATFPQRRVYSLLTLVVLTTGYIISWILFLIPFITAANRGEANSTTALPPLLTGFMDIGVAGLLAVAITFLILDWRGFTTINGWIKWSRMKLWQKLVLGYFFIGFMPYTTIPYLIQAYKSHFDDNRQEPFRLRQKIAIQEAQLGIIPQINGCCRICQKPLQQAAEYCMYCATPVNEYPRICPKCATVTLPDAHWCPSCRTPLGGS